MSRFLIDTHCHVHIYLSDGTETAETACCATSKQTETCMRNISSEGSSRREARDDRLATDKSDEDSGARSMGIIPPEVVHITMGIKEDDWLGAVRFAATRDAAAADNLRSVLL